MLVEDLQVRAVALLMLGNSSARIDFIAAYSNPTRTPPVFWTEVFSRADSRWFPVDPIRGIVNERHVFDPSNPQNSELSSKIHDNRMLYVVALEEDGFGRDVTARYARNYAAKVLKAQGLGSGSVTERKQWWAKVVQHITRPFRLVRFPNPRGDVECGAHHPTLFSE